MLNGFSDNSKTAGTLGIRDLAVTVPGLHLGFGLIDRCAFPRRLDFFADFHWCPTETVTNRRFRVRRFLEANRSRQVLSSKENLLRMEVDNIATRCSAETKFVLNRNP